MAEEVVTPAWRSPRYNAVGTIDMEIQHPVYGWIPFTADPNDVEPMGQALYNAAIELGEIGNHLSLSPDALQNLIVAAVQERLDAFARSRGYDSILSATTYATSSVPQFAAEGRRAVELRDATWARLCEMLAEVQSGNRPAPNGYAQVESELPVLSWET